MGTQKREDKCSMIFYWNTLKWKCKDIMFLIYASSFTTHMKIPSAVIL